MEQKKHISWVITAVLLINKIYTVYPPVCLSIYSFCLYTPTASAIYLYISPSICYSIYLPYYMSINLSLYNVSNHLYPSIYPSTYTSTVSNPAHTYPSFCLSIHLSTHYIPAYLPTSVYLSIYWTIYRHLLHYLPVSPSLYPSTLVFIHLPTYLSI